MRFINKLRVRAGPHVLAALGEAAELSKGQEEVPAELLLEGMGKQRKRSRSSWDRVDVLVAILAELLPEGRRS